MNVELLALLGGVLIAVGWLSERIQRHKLGRDDA